MFSVGIRVRYMVRFRFKNNVVWTVVLEKIDYYQSASHVEGRSG